MTRLGFALSVAALVAAAVWTYHVNYRTKTALERIDRLRAEIAAEREAGEVLKVEWAYLNAPDRLARLVADNNDALKLSPMLPSQFDTLDQIPFRPTPLQEQEAQAQAEAAAAAEEVRVEQALVAQLGVPLPPRRPLPGRPQ